MGVGLGLCFIGSQQCGSPGYGWHHSLKQKPENPEPLRGEDWRAMAPLPFPDSALLSWNSCWESSQCDHQDEETHRLEVFRGNPGEAEDMRDTTDRAGHRIPATKVWVSWTSGSAGVKHLALVPACPPPPLTLLDLIPSCLGKPGFQRCECENVPGLCFLCVGCVCKYICTLCGRYFLLLSWEPPQTSSLYSLL